MISKKLLKKAIQMSYTQDTAYDSSKRNKNRPSLWHCSLVSLIINEYYGGDILQVPVIDQNNVEQRHFLNKIGKNIVDRTKDQFWETVLIKWEDQKAFTRDELLTDYNRRQRYLAFQSRVQEQLYLITHSAL